MSAEDGCQPQNLLSNPGFETGTTTPDDWTTFPPSPPGVTYEWDDAVFAGGTRSVSVESTGGFGMWRQVVPVSPGTVYRLSGYVRVENVEPPGHCNLQVIFRDAGGEILEWVDLSSHSGSIPWMYDFPHEANVRAPAGSTIAEVNLYLQGQGKAWFDDIFFGPTPTGSISGTVTSGGEPLAGARVSIWGTDYEAVTDEQGRYLLSNIPDASPRYILIASKDGYKDKPQGDVDVVACQTTTVNFDLEAGANLEDPELRVKFGSLALAQRVPLPQIPPDAVIDPDIYPDSVLPYLQPSEYIDSDHPSVIAVAQEILASLPPEDRTNAREVSYAVYRWIIENIEYDVIYANSTFTDVTSGSWQTISGEGWSWGHNFNDWLYKPSEMLAERRGICVEHSRLAAALLRAVGIPARPVSPYSAQFWVQSPSGEGTWVAMGTSGGRSAYRERGNTQAEYGTLSPGAVRFFPVDEGPVIHSDWYTENKCMWREVHPWGERYEGTPAGYQQAVADLEEFAQTGEAPQGQPVPPGSELHYEIAYSDFTLHLSNIGDQRTFVVRFPIITASSYVTPTGDVAYWTNHPEWVTRTWIEEKTNPPVEGVERWFYIEFDLSDLQWRRIYLPQILKNYTPATPIPTPTPTPPSHVQQLPIHLVYVNHVEVESVLDYVPPLGDGTTYTTTPEKYAFTSGQLEWEIAQAEAVGARISFHMSGAYAEQAVAAGDQARWAQHLADGHTVGVHFHKFLRGPEPFQWTYRVSPDQEQIVQAWQDNHDLVAGLVGPEQLWVGESHYGCPSCWEDLGYRLRTTEQLALLPAGQHIVWLVERDPSGVITYPHFPQIGQAGWHGPAQSRTYFDLRLPQLKKEFLMLYLEWLERERLGLEPQVWAWGWANHGGRSTAQHAEEIQEMLTWLKDNFVGRASPRGNVIARFVSDHELSDIYEAYEQSGGRPLPSPVTNVNDQFPYLAYALRDAGVTADLSADLGLPGIRLFELERDPPANPPPGRPPRVYLLFRETDGTETVDISAVLESRGVDATSLTLVDVVDGSTGQVDGRSLLLGPTPLVLEASYTTDHLDSPFGFHPAGVYRPGYPDNGFVDAQNIGVRWTRQGVYAFWFLIQPDLNEQVYDFSLYDRQWSAVPQGINILANIAPQGPIDEGRCLPGSWLPVDEAKYVAFVKATVERYDGDGVHDVAPGVAVKYWQAGNEIPIWVHSSRPPSPGRSTRL